MAAVGTPDYDLGDRILAALGDLVDSSPDVLGGRPVLRGTRVPVEVLFENLADGMSIDQILVEYETLDRDDVWQAVDIAMSVPRS